MIHCPLCYSAMVVESDHGVEIDRCGRCNALWFDYAELESFADRCPRVTATPPDLHRLRSKAHGDPRACPRCQGPLFLGTLGANPYAVCQSCFGVALSDGAVLEILYRQRQVAEVAASGATAPGTRRRVVGVVEGVGDGVCEMVLEGALELLVRGIFALLSGL